MRNLFVIAADDHNMQWLEPLADRWGCQFRPVLTPEDIQSEQASPFEEPLARCMDELDRFDGSIDGIMGYWDFPVTSMLPILRARYGCPGANVDAVLSCEHKYYSRILQREVAPAHVPIFRAIDPFDDEQVADLHREPGYPFWIKPIKSHSSQLGFRVDGRRDLVHAVKRIRRGIARFSEPFAAALAHGTLPTEIAEIDGGKCLVERLIGGRLCTLEGYVHRGEVIVPTIVDSITVGGGSSFARYQYPSRLPEPVKERMRELAARVIRRHGYDEATFNIEIYWDEDADHLWLLEINPRASQSHTVITTLVDGVPHLESAAALALGEPPGPHQHARGRYAVAAKFFFRVDRDALVERVPTDGEVGALEQEIDGSIQILARPGKRLSQILDQDSYSFAIAMVHLGASDEQELLDKYDRCAASLHFAFRDDAEVRAAL